MKVVHIVEALGGGINTYFKDLTNFFGNYSEQLGIETYVIYSAKRKEIDPKKISEDFSDKVTLIEIEMNRELSPIQDLQSAFKIREILKEIKPDIVHLHSSKAGVIGRWASFLLIPRKNIFYTPHGYSFLRQDVSKFKRKIFNWIEKYNQLFFGGTTIACGDTEYAIAKRLGSARLIRNGVNIKLLEKFYIPIENKRLKIGFIGRIAFQRNPLLFNKIALLHPQYDFIWIGDGEGKHLLTAPNIKITGWHTNNLDIFPILNELDIYIQTSLWEGLPISVLEASALRKPILATNVIGNKDIIKNGINGFLFEKAAETTSILKQLEEKKKREEMGNNAYLIVKDKFCANKNFSLLSDIYLRE